MKPPPFEYRDPHSVEEVVSLLVEADGEAKLLAGGQSLVPMLNMRVARPGMLVDLGRVEGLDFIRESNGADGSAGLAVGAMTTKRSLEFSALTAERQPLLQAATRLIAHPQIRNRGTIGGSMAQADPAAEYPAVAVALDAEMTMVGPGGTRSVAAEDFFITFLTTALAEDELLIELRFPAMPDRSGWSVQEIARRHGDFAMVGATTWVTLDDRGRIGDARIVLFGVGPVPLRARGAEEIARGESPGQALFERVGQKAAEEIEEPLADVHASAVYRRQLASVLVRRTLTEAAARV